MDKEKQGHGSLSVNRRLSFRSGERHEDAHHLVPHQVMLQGSPAGGARCERTDARKRIRADPGPSLKTRYGETITQNHSFGSSVRIQVFGQYAGGEGSGECNLESLPGRLNEESQGIVSHLGSIGSLRLRFPSGKDLDDQVQAFLLRPIEQAIPYLFVDASYTKSGTEHGKSAV